MGKENRFCYRINKKVEDGSLCMAWLFFGFGAAMFRSDGVSRWLAGDTVNALKSACFQGTKDSDTGASQGSRSRSLVRIVGGEKRKPGLKREYV